MYRSARAMPSSLSTAPSFQTMGSSCCQCGYHRWLFLESSSSATVRTIQIVLIAIALVMAIVNAFNVLPMILVMDSNVMTGE